MSTVRQRDSSFLALGADVYFSTSFALFNNFIVSVLHKLTCNVYLACLPGERYNGMSKKCAQCPRNMYQPLLGQLECVPCPNNTITNNIGSDELDDCIQCKYSNRGNIDFLIINFNY